MRLFLLSETYSLLVNGFTVINSLSISDALEMKSINLCRSLPNKPT